MNFHFNVYKRDSWSGISMGFYRTRNEPNDCIRFVIQSFYWLYCLQQRKRHKCTILSNLCDIKLPNYSLLITSFRPERDFMRFQFLSIIVFLNLLTRRVNVILLNTGRNASRLRAISNQMAPPNILTVGVVRLPVLHRITHCWITCSISTPLTSTVHYVSQLCFFDVFIKFESKIQTPFTQRQKGWNSRLELILLAFCMWIKDCFLIFGTLLSGDDLNKKPELKLNKEIDLLPGISI